MVVSASSSIATFVAPRRFPQTREDTIRILFRPCLRTLWVGLAKSGQRRAEGPPLGWIKVEDDSFIDSDSSTVTEWNTRYAPELVILSTNIEGRGRSRRTPVLPHHSRRPRARKLARPKPTSGINRFGISPVLPGRTSTSAWLQVALSLYLELLMARLNGRLLFTFRLTLISISRTNHGQI